jgi:hypothetical protein
MRSRHAGGWSWFAVAVIVGTLVVSGVAVAKHLAASTTAVSATFAATTVSHRTTKTCTGADGTYEVTHAKYTGTATSTDARLDGTLEVRVKSVYNTAENLGWLRADLKVRDADGKVEARGRLHAVNANGQLEGLLDGHVRGPHAHLLGNLSAAFTSAGGFASGTLGSGNAANTAIVFERGCQGGDSSQAKHKDKPDRSKHDKGHKTKKR